VCFSGTTFRQVYLIITLAVSTIRNEDRGAVLYIHRSTSHKLGEISQQKKMNFYMYFLKKELLVSDDCCGYWCYACQEVVRSFVYNAPVAVLKNDTTQSRTLPTIAGWCKPNELVAQ